MIWIILTSFIIFTKINYHTLLQPLINILSCLLFLTDHSNEDNDKSGVDETRGKSCSNDNSGQSNCGYTSRLLPNFKNILEKLPSDRKCLESDIGSDQDIFQKETSSTGDNGDNSEMLQGNESNDKRIISIQNEDDTDDVIFKNIPFPLSNVKEPENRAENVTKSSDSDESIEMMYECSSDKVFLHPSVTRKCLRNVLKRWVFCNLTSKHETSTQCWTATTSAQHWVDV